MVTRPVRQRGRRAASRARRIGSGLLAALVAAALLPAAALAHATLQATVPERGATLDTPPAEVVFRFDEAVEASFGALRVFDSSGKEVQSGDAYHPANQKEQIAVKLRSGLGDGTYTATYHVISADGHPVSSGFVFTVGEASAPAESLDQLLAGGTPGTVTTAALGVARSVQYAAIALGLGVLLFFVAVWRGRSRPFAARLERLLLVAAAAGLISALAALILQGAIGSGSSFWSAARPDTVREVLGTRFGRAWGLGALAWLLVAALLATRPLRGTPAAGEAITPAGDAPAPPDAAAAPRAGSAPGGGAPRPAATPGGGVPRPAAALADGPLAATAPTGEAVAVAIAAPARSATATVAAAPAPTARLIALAVPLVALALLPSFGGHTSVQSPVAVLLPANILHVLAMAAWLGGIAVLVFALRSATSALAPQDRTPLLAGTVARFSALATIALPLLLLSGVVQAIVEVNSFGALLDTAFGRSVLAKLVVALLILGLGYVNRQKLVPGLKTAAAGGTSPGRAGVLIRRTLQLELALGLVALAATGFLSSYAPSVAESAGPYSTSAIVGPARMEVTVDPAKVGPNQLHVYLFDRKSGAAFEATKELRITAAMPDKQIAPIELSPHVAGPGHFVVDGASLTIAGDWTIHVVDRVSDFDEYETRFSVPIE